MPKIIIYLLASLITFLVFNFSYTAALGQSPSPSPSPSGGTAGRRLQNPGIKGICLPGTADCQSTEYGEDPCPGSTTAEREVRTAIGCVPTNPSSLVNGLIRVVAFASGGIALLLMSFGAIKMITSAGSPEALKAGQEQFNAAIMGLLFVIFSVLLLQIIGVQILSIPGFGG